MFLIILYLSIALTVSFLCSVLEAVILSVTVPFIETKEREVGSKVKLLRKYKENIDKPLSAILSLNTVAHTVGATGVGAQAAIVFENVSTGVVSAVLTILILIFSEILPKTIGAKYWKQLSIASASVIHIMIIITYPLVLLSELTTKMFKKSDENKTSREEISVLAEIGTKEGILQEGENTIIQNIIKMSESTVDEAMTPRTVVVAAQKDMSLNDFLKDDRYKSFTRVPIFSENLDDVNGYILRPIVYEYIFDGKGHLPLKSIEREFVVVYSNLSLESAWKEFLIRGEHIALVVDQFGGVDGIISMEDVIESIFGLEIIDERDSSVDMQQVARERWIKIKESVEEI